MRIRAHAVYIWDMDKQTNSLSAELNDARAKYDAGMARFREVSRKHSEVRKAYHARTIEDAEFLASRAHLAATADIADALESEYIRLANLAGEC